VEGSYDLVSNTVMAFVWKKTKRKVSQSGKAIFAPSLLLWSNLLEIL
jgi:hypothetical protein